MARYISKADRVAERVSDIVERKKRVSDNIQMLRNFLLHEITVSVDNNETVLELNARLLKAYNLPRWGKYKDKRILTECTTLGKRLLARKKMDRNFNVDRCVKEIITSKTIGTTNKERLDYTNKFETMRKKEILDKTLESSPNDIFVVCSAHSQPAPDHKARQGKVYIRKDWRDRISESDNKKKLESSIRAYCDRNKVRTVEWVCGAPVYMIFRPNCKHFMLPVETSEILDSSISKVLVKHKLLRDEPDNIPQTNARRNYRRHLNKLKVLEQMPKTNETKRQIQIEKQFINKYLVIIKQEQSEHKRLY